MIDIPRRIIVDAKEDGQSILENYLLANYPMGEIIKAFAELILTADDAINKPQITVTQAEYEAMVGLFKIKGQRIVNGEVIKESRGRPKKEVPSAGDNTYKLDL